MTSRKYLPGPDALVADCGTIWTLCPLTDAAKRWAEDNISSEPMQYLGNVICIEHRFIFQIISGFQRAGLEVRYA